MSDPVDWDAATYHRVADNQEEWGREVLDRLELKGDETVLDAGCGSGRVTRLLLERLPEGRVIGVDAAPSMIEEARANLAEFGDRVELQVQNLLELELDAAGRRGLLERDLPLDRRPRSPLRPPPRGAAAGRRPSRRSAGERATSPSSSGAVESAMGDERFVRVLPRHDPAVELRLGRRHRGPPRARRLRGGAASGSSSEASSRRSPASTCGRSGSNPHLARCPTTSRTSSSTPCSARCCGRCSSTTCG